MPSQAKPHRLVRRFRRKLAAHRLRVASGAPVMPRAPRGVGARPALADQLQYYAEAPRAIGLCGPEGVGKSTLAQLLVRERGFVPFKFADPLKNMLRAYYETLLLTPAEIERRLEGDLKETACEFLLGLSPRHAMRTLGTEWGRDCMGRDFWVEAWLRHVDRPTAVNPIVTDDVRFVNEGQAVRAVGGIVIEITHPGAVYSCDHVSDTAQVRPDYAIRNVTDNAADMLRQVDVILAGRRAVLDEAA